MIVNLSGVGLRRDVRGIDFSDLTASEVVRGLRWVGDGVLEIPFVPDPSPAEAELIRRRLVTQDAAEEQRVGDFLAVLTALEGDDSPCAVAVRLLITERLDEVREPQ